MFQLFLWCLSTDFGRGFGTQEKSFVHICSTSPQVVGLLFIIVSKNGILLVLVLGNEIPDVLVRLLELHLVHALSLVPVEEGLPLVHSAELCGESLEDALERGGVGNEGARLLGVLGGHFNNGGLHVVGDPLNEVVGVGGLALLDILVNLLRGHAASEEEGGRHVLAIIG